MKKKIKLTEKDLRIEVKSSDIESVNNPDNRNYPTYVGCPTQTSCYYCPPVVSDVCEKTEYCGIPVTKDTACVVTGACVETYINCVESDNCLLSNKCEETEICEYSADGDCGETFPCPFSIDGCEQPDTENADVCVSNGCLDTFNCNCN